MDKGLRISFFNPFFVSLNGLHLLKPKASRARSTEYPLPKATKETGIWSSGHSDSSEKEALLSLTKHTIGSFNRNRHNRNRCIGL
uniref:Uncharacterized protein n=1 Tax=Utricularia reniformis TaxID=192314 RepID=A0A1Y0B465_9LAMI|nr:hypothetical protein AEK19_MT2031 [Utricularia reniformis]ART32190.1 hypothetical protein AEK19_MT2031 [Utricularia reniformis]